MSRLTTLLFLCLAVTFPCTLLAQSEQALSLQGKWQTLYQRSWNAVPVTVSQQTLNQYPTTLLQESARYPNFERFSWQEIQSLATLVATCRNHPADQSKTLLSTTNQELKDAITFELALCHQQALPTQWFSSHSLLHPAGGSFADRYVTQYPDSLTQLTNYLTIANPHHPLFTKLSPLSTQGREALFSGFRAWLESDGLQDNTLWLSGEQGWKAIPDSTWQPLTKELNISLNSESCTLHYSNLCISERTDHYQTFTQAIIGFLSLLIVIVSLRGIFIKRQQSRERSFILQLLTHELRTPITSLGLTVEMFREQYDHMSPEGQDATWRLISDFQRLSQLTENSKIYLSTTDSAQLLEQPASLDEWLEYVCKKHNVPYQLSHDQELNLPYYWLTVCLDNLIKNAKQHGQGKVIVRAKLTNKVTIEVQDEGQLPHPIIMYLSRWPLLNVIHNSTKQRKHHDNMGIGLTIVSHLMKKAGGKLLISRNPTRFILELPYENHSID
ncbi:histidine kinase [Photobacterium jeanii]|uniref:histidine kinase n=1 Tax=Photobacterium jeanii TaxID=858640 RepID=A0A178KLC1_9GAMM|nr:DUF3404 domain-containing protein [Photobacterium jeanii]OAN18051.1 histidine kinase [Photobacterium jeanii]PST92276.1 DUF3404 domain-containing protein [Photobacterium jeanii]